MPKTTSSVIRQLQVVFTLSTILLLISLIASFYSIQKLISNSKLVNHTNQVLIEAENIISHMKDAETGQRGYLVTLDPSFLEPYNGAYEKTTNSYNQLAELTGDNPRQQKNLAEVKQLYEAKFAQMRKVIDLVRRNQGISRDTARQNAEMTKGKKVMDDLRAVITRIKTDESKLLTTRLEQQQIYINFTPWLLVVAAFISMLITAMAYIRIKQDLDKRLVEQQKAEEKYVQTARRIAVMEDITQDIANGDYAVRSEDTQDDELGRIGNALNTMTGALQRT